MLLIHGRKDPEENLDQWGFDGTDIENIAAVHSAYGNLVIYFKNIESAVKAQAQTGWKEWDLNALEVQQYEDLISTSEGFFGDYELQDDN